MAAKTFKNYRDLTSSLAFDLRDRIRASDWRSLEVDGEYGASNVSCSAYLEVSVEDEDADLYESFKIRFSDHSDYHGSDVIFRINDKITVDECDGEYVSTQIESTDYEQILSDAMVAVERFIASEIN